MKAFLEAHGSEVANMLLSGWNMDEALAVSKEYVLDVLNERYREVQQSEMYHQQRTDADLVPRD